ncbi:YceI family protein [Halobacteriovorax sp. HLS]|uniref:YceI family protein n=1 Tax=Halobacteriovorax sp. HLS TaxID=2234000 RepID=UPI000FDB0F13|nr:YceI family protein [Halobacteriovorax sp. HLS]
MKLSLLLLFFTFPSLANCYQLDNKSVSIKWTSYKTAKKVGVSGTFKKVTFKTDKKQKSINSILKSAHFSIDTDSVSTKDLGRDKKIAKFFFSTMTGGSKITGKTKELKKKSIVMTFNINGKSVDVPLSYSVKKNSLEAKGVIDVFDFSLNKQLAALNKACFAKHEGKTWNDVAIQINAKFNKCK